MKANKLLCIFASTFLFTGCLHQRASYTNRPVLTLPPDIAQRFEYSHTKKVHGELRTTKTLRECEVRQYFLSVVILYNGSSKELIIDVYLPKGDGPFPVIILLPISGGGYQLEEYFARYFARHGFAVIIVHREKKKDRNPKTGEEINRVLTQSVIDNRQVIDWILTQPQLDANQIFVQGTSMGSLKAVLLTGVDERVRGVVLGLVGSDLPYIISHSSEKGVAKRRRTYLLENDMTVAEFQEDLERTITCDPNLFAPYIERKKVMLILGAFDKVVPFKKGLELRRNLDKPETVFVASGHYSSLVYLPYIRSVALKFFKERLKTSPKHSVVVK